MKHMLPLLPTAMLLGYHLNALTGVANITAGNDPDTSAVLDVRSTEK